MIFPGTWSALNQFDNRKNPVRENQAISIQKRERTPWGTALWMGRSRRVYSYDIYPLDVELGAGPVNYIYAKRGAGARWIPIYIGQTGNIADQPAEIARQLECIIRQGATNIHVHTNFIDRARILEEADLRRAFE